MKVLLTGREEARVIGGADCDYMIRYSCLVSCASQSLPTSTVDVAASALPAAFMHQHMSDRALEDQALLPSVRILDQGRQSGFFLITCTCCLYIKRKEERMQNTSGKVAKESKHVKTNGKRDRIIAPNRMGRKKIKPRESKSKKQNNHTKEKKRVEEDHTTQMKN